MTTKRHETTDIASRCTSLNLRRAARAASAFLEQYLEPVGLHASQFGCLNRIGGAGSITITRLADESALDRTTLTRNLQVLQRDGLVSVCQGQDRRQREAMLTTKGQRVLAQAIPLWEQAEAALTTTLGAENRHALARATDALLALDTT